MSRRPKMELGDAAPDYGPNHVLTKGGQLKRLRGPAEVVIEDRGDISKPGTGRTVRGARRRNVLIDLLSRDVIDKRMYDAVQDFLDECSMATAGGMTAGDMMAVVRSGKPSQGLPERQTSAITKVRRIWASIPIREDGIFFHVVFQNRGIRDFEDINNIEHGKASRKLCDDLTALAGFFQYRTVIGDGVVIRHD